jgi:hypothetical protein
VDNLANLNAPRKAGLVGCLACSGKALGHVHAIGHAAARAVRRRAHALVVAPITLWSSLSRVEQVATI